MTGGQPGTRTSTSSSIGCSQSAPLAGWAPDPRVMRDFVRTGIPVSGAWHRPAGPRWAGSALTVVWQHVASDSAPVVVTLAT